jgi:hypothetical protein
MKNRLSNNIEYVIEGRQKSAVVADNVYYLRHADNDWSIPLTVENNVCCNYWGLLITKNPLKFKDYLRLSRKEIVYLIGFIN